MFELCVVDEENVDGVEGGYGEWCDLVEVFVCGFKYVELVEGSVDVGCYEL